MALQIGKRYNLTVTQLTAANPELKDPNNLQLGADLALPCSKNGQQGRFWGALKHGST
jgi:hypothetical protein